jgi:DNA-binding response OmpR family regulator
VKVLIAEDDLIPRCMLQGTLTDWGYEVVALADGEEALRVLEADDAPKLGILDWGLPSMTGVDVCCRVRAQPTADPPYLILLTGRDAPADIVAGLDSGADDYITKPFDPEELRARLQVGRRILALQSSLAARVRELEETLARVKQLEGLLPICSYCKKIRDDCNYWQRVEDYLSRHTEVRLSHGICPDCWESEVKPQLKQAGVEADLL